MTKENIKAVVITLVTLLGLFLGYKLIENPPVNVIVPNTDTTTISVTPLTDSLASDSL